MIKKEKRYYNKSRYLSIRKHLLSVLSPIVIYTPPSYTTLLGVTKMDVMGKALMGILDVKTVEDYNQLMGVIRAAARKKENVKIDFQPKDKKGRYNITINDVLVAQILSFNAAKFLRGLLRDILFDEGFEVT